MKYIQSLKEFTEELADQGEFDRIINQCYWDDGFAVWPFYHAMKTSAMLEGWFITDEDEASFDFETFFWNLYKSSPEGLR